MDTCVMQIHAPPFLKNMVNFNLAIITTNVIV